MNKTKKRALLLTVAIAIFAVFANIAVFADNLAIPKPQPVNSEALGFGRILGFIQAIGVAVALGMLIIIGIRYVAADAGKKGEIKDQAITYVFGAFCIFAAVAILEIIKKASTALTTG